jgi:ABC-2 type transport system ATP-binding protein
MEALLTIQGLFVSRRGTEVLRGLDLDLAPGEVTVLLGANGAGKTTLLLALLGKLRVRAGTIRLDGLDPLRGRREERAYLERIGYVPDRSDVPGWMKLHELWRYLAPRYPRWNTDLGEEIASRFEIPRDPPLARLSLGQTALALLATAVASQPRLLLLDEPFSNLDPAAREDFVSALVGLDTLAECAALLTTHDLELAARVADQIAWLEEGRIARLEDPSHLSTHTWPLPDELRAAYRPERKVTA